jgi:hypothetical protein
MRCRARRKFFNQVMVAVRLLLGPVLFAFVLTTLATVILILHMPDVSAVADAAQTASPQDLDRNGGDLFHAVLALVLLLVIQVLNLTSRQAWRPTGGARISVSGSRGARRRYAKAVASFNVRCVGWCLHWA